MARHGGLLQLQLHAGGTPPSSVRGGGGGPVSTKAPMPEAAGAAVELADVLTVSKHARQGSFNACGPVLILQSICACDLLIHKYGQ